MKKLLPFRAPTRIASTALALALIASACAGERPTLTSDRIADATSVPSPVPTLSTESATTAVAEPTPAATEAADAPDNGAAAPAGAVEQLVPVVLESFPHDPNAFTQGLELHDGAFIESTGLRFESDLRRVDPQTGEVTQIVATPDGAFAEGLTKVGNELIQLTWTEQIAFYWDATTFDLIRTVTYDGEGWGLCYDGSQLVMTDGTPELIFRDPATFEETGRVGVTLEGQEVFNLNEVECVNGAVWANLWRTDLIVRIDPVTGVVNAVVDASSLDRPPLGQADVLNGIAWDQSTESFWVTGKLWPTMYRVTFEPAEQ